MLFNLASIALAVLSFGFNFSADDSGLNGGLYLFDAYFGYLNHFPGMENGLNHRVANSIINDSNEYGGSPADSTGILKKADSVKPFPKSLNKGKTAAKSDVSSNSSVKKDFQLFPLKPDSASIVQLKPDTVNIFPNLSHFISDSLSKKARAARLAALADTIRIDQMTLDSTARLEYFHYQRSDPPYVTMRNKKPSKFFAQSKTFAKEKKIEFDSTGEYVQISEKVAGQQTKILLRLKFDDYVSMRLHTRQRELWEDMGYKYEVKQTEKDLGGLIKDFTNFEIPLPSVGMLSIFGPQKISLKIGGSVTIHGAWRNETTEGATASGYGNSTNQPDFKQQVQINVDGTIGDKLTISADWNTERTFEYENMLKIKYTGYSDEIVQSVEAGNVSLQTSSLVGGGEALFGVKAAFKMGPLTLTTLASQKKGETKEVSLSGGSSSNTFIKRAYDYSQNHFFLDTLYTLTTDEFNIFYNYYGKNPSVQNTKYTIGDKLEVWKNITTSTTNANERNANAYIDLKCHAKNVPYNDELRQKLTDPTPGKQETGRFIKLTEGTDYVVHRETGYISFTTGLQSSDVIAVSYNILWNDKSSSDDDMYYGEPATTTKSTDSTRLILKLIKPANLQPQYTTAWKLMLKNIYPIGGRSINKDGFTLDIKYVKEGVDSLSTLNNLKLIQAFGLDKVDATGSANPDGAFDFDTYRQINTSTGEIIFPYLQPFGDNIPASFDSLKFSEVYNSTYTVASQQTSKDKFIIVGQYSGSSSSSFSIGYNIVENSVKVTLDGRVLTAGVDYVMDYNVGQLTIKNEAALVPNANLKISYEQNDLFQLASKTLVGARGVFDFSPKTKLGFSILNLTQQTLSDKVRLGEEPISNTMFGLDLSTSADLPLVTKMLDNVVSTKEKSSVSFTGEVAYMKPDPNTKKSTIASDKGKSIAYIDDFEGSTKTIPIGVTFSSWKDISVPEGLPVIADSDKLVQMNYKGKAFWYNRIPSQVTDTQIWPKKSISSSSQQVTVLDFEFRPTIPGAYNYQKTPLTTSPELSWGGMMKSVSSTASNLTDENIEYIEFWLNTGDSKNLDNKFYIDIGQVSEDVIPDLKLNTEDLNANGLIDNDAEDTGLDNELDVTERTNHPNGDTDDPAHDNWANGVANSGNPDDYLHYNGTQGNRTATEALGNYCNTEDLNGNNSLDVANSYYEYEVPISKDTSKNKFLVADAVSANGWRMYRIPLKDYQKSVGAPSFSNIQTVRVYVKNAKEIVHLKFVEFNFAGNQWLKAITSDTVMQLSTVNIEDNSSYSSPPGVQREADKSNPDNVIYKNEQSLKLTLNELKPDSSREIVKYLTKTLDVFSYKQMKLFIWGDKDKQFYHNGVSYYKDVNNHNAEVYFRFGTDTSNYYEYRQPVQADWNEISITFKDLTTIKQTRASNSTKRDSLAVAGKPGNYYVVKGNPSLQSLKTLIIGITNTTKDSVKIIGDVYVDELRVVDADDTPGWAYTASTSIKLADIMNVNLNISRTDPNFHTLASRFGSRTDSRSWGVSADLDVLKILPFNMQGGNLKLTFSHTESIAKPQYIPGSDISVEEAAKNLKEADLKLGYTESQASKAASDLIGNTQTISVSDSWSSSGIKLKLPSDYWLIRDSFNALTFGFNYNKAFSRSPTVLNNSSWVWNANMNYSVNFSPDLYFYPANIPVLGRLLALFPQYRNAKVYFTPQNFSADITAKRNRNYSITRATSSSDPYESITRDFGTTRGCSFSWKMTDGGLLNLTTSYSVDVNSSLAFLETDAYNKERSEKSIWNEILSGVFFGRDYSYSQNIDIKTNPQLPNLWNLNKFFTLSAGYTVRYSWAFDFTADTVGRSAGYESKLNFATTLRWKDLTAPLFPSEEVTNGGSDNRQNPGFPEGQSRGRRREDNPNGNPPPGGGGMKHLAQTTVPDSLMFRNMPDSLRKIALDSLKRSRTDTLQRAASTPDTTIMIKKTPIYAKAFYMTRALARIILFDYENIGISFNESNSMRSSGILGKGNGSKNFLGISYNVNDGPKQAYILGLSNDVGARAHNATLADNFSQSNNVELKTSKPLWDGAKVDVNWKIGWSMQKATSFNTDNFGNVSGVGITTTGTLDRSFLSLPPTLMFSVFKSGIKKVNQLFNESANKTNADLSDAFVNGFETMPVFSKLKFLNEVVKYIPRPNWRLTWDGLEKYSFFKSFTQKVSINHAYSADYTEGWKIDNDGTKETQSQRITYAFSPLLEISMTFKSLWDGNFNGKITCNTKSDYSLGSSTQTIVESFTRDIGITIGYSKSGFEIPFFGLSLKNDFDFSFTYTNTKTSNVNYDFTDFTEDGTPQEINTGTSLEPRIKYVISSKVTLSVYYKRTSRQPEGTSKLTATTTNEAGLDVTISIN